MIRPGRIDVHQHFLPPGYARWLESGGIAQVGGRAIPDWDADKAIGLMDQFSISTGILSLSAPGVYLGDGTDARTMATQVNEAAAECVWDRPDRFGFFATVPLPDVDGALEAAAHAFDSLNADGVCLLANYQGIYLGEPVFDPLMAELDRRHAVVLVHPAELPGPAVPSIPPFATDFLLDTSRAAFNLVRHEVPRRYPNITFILAHAGGFVPYASHRVAVGVTAETGRDPFEVLEDLQGFYFDTALSSSPAALPTLLAFAKPGHVLFGTDWPFAPDIAVAYFTGQLDSYDDLDSDARVAINHGNVQALFPRLIDQE
ncbi:amidohydrolase 2 [Parafrankia sp. EAN1pec]|uniref:amidohydrolase family protein n=1 Tax=Parafrankia sp. (strain EAN1pec) TaxID=298653 RepID=UPI00005413CF|nr:amidohydrolase 2 [Frankia sp. EAN1pec]